MISAYHWEAVTPFMRAVMTGFSQTEVGKSFYLAGGTALALQLGHRRSVDLDFFSPTEDVPTLRESLSVALETHHPVLVDTAFNNLIFLAGSLSVGFYGYGYPMARPLVMAEGVSLASVEDIGLMKMDAILGRASRKDFIDLYFISQHYSLRELLDLAAQKYPDVRDFEVQVVRQLVYFERAEQEEPPPLFQDVSWNTVKDYFRQQAVAIGRQWIR